MDRKVKKILWGVFFVLVGLLILLSNYHLLNFSFQFSRDWPIILIAWGFLKIIDVLTSRRKSDSCGSFIHIHTDKMDYKELFEVIEKFKVNIEQLIRKIKEEYKDN